MSTIASPPCDAGQIQGGRASAAPCRHGTWVLAATILGSSMVFIDGTVVSVALPVLQSDFHASASQVQWIVEAYALFLAALLLLGGSLGDHFGRRRIFALGVVLFTVSSMLCGAAPDITFLSVARAVQGIGGALLAPSSLAIISASFDSEERGRAIGTWSGFTAITAAIGPALGGWLVQHASWRSVFYLNVPFAVIVLILVWKHVDESYGDRSGHIDWPGASLVTIGLAAVTFALIRGSGTGLLSALPLASFVIGVLALVAFVVVEDKSSSPMVPLTLFRSRTFSGANILTFLLYGALGGALYFVPFDLIQIQGYSPTEAGGALLPFIFIMFLLSRWSGGLVARVGARLPLIVGPSIAAVGLALFARPGVGGSYWTTILPAVVVLGLGMATAVAPLTTTVMTSVGDEHAGLASGVNNAVSRTASLLSVAILSLVMVAVFTRGLDGRVDAAPVAPDIRQSIEAQSGRLAAITLPPNLSDEATLALRQAIGDSFVAGFRTVMIAAAALALVSSIVSATMIGGKRAAVARDAQRPNLGADIPEAPA